MQCKALRDSAAEIQKFDVAYFMASVDSIEDNTKFAAEHNAGFPILSDPGKETAKAYGVMHPMGFTNRWTYYIDKEGVVKKIDQAVDVKTAGQDLARILGELDFHGK